MGNAHREYVVFTKDEFWELWRCHGNKAWLLGDSTRLAVPSKMIPNSKDNICNIRKGLGFDKFYGNKKEVEEYLFILAV